MFVYAKYGELIDLEHRSLKLVFGFIQSAIDRDREAYKEKCRINSENAAKGGKRKAEKEKEKQNEKPNGINMSFDQLIESIS